MLIQLQEESFATLIFVLNDVMSAKQDPIISLFAAASVGAFLLTSWLAHDYSNIIIPFLFLSMICANGFGYYLGLSASK